MKMIFWAVPKLIEIGTKKRGTDIYCENSNLPENGAWFKQEPSSS